MQRRGLLGAASLLAVLVTLGLAPVKAQQEPIVFGVITPLSPPGETALGQLAKRGAEIGVEYINEKGGVLGRKVALSVHDSAGKNEQGVAAYRRLVSSEKAVAVFGFIHSGVNIAVNEVAKEMGVPTMGTQTGASDVTAKHYDIAFRTHAVDPPRAATWLGWIQKNKWKRVSVIAETTDYGIGLAKETEKQNKEQEPRPRDPDDHVRSHDDRSPAAASAGQGLQAGRHRQYRRRPAARSDDHAGAHRRPAAGRADGDVLRCAGATAVLAAARRQGRRHQLHRLLCAEVGAVGSRQGVRQALSGEVQRAAGLCGAERLRQRHRVRRRPSRRRSPPSRRR